jgi:hypothetical protein
MVTAAVADGALIGTISVARVHGLPAGARDAADPQRHRGDDPQPAVNV